MFNQVHNASNVHTFHAELSGNIRDVIVALPKASDFANDIPIGRRPPCDVLNQAHEELIFARCLGNDRWYCRFAKSNEGLDPSLTADKIELLALCIWFLASHHRDGLLKPDLSDVGDHHLPPSTASWPGIGNINLDD